MARSKDAPQVYPNTMSVYGPTRADSVGFNANNPEAYTATKAAKAYTSPSRKTPKEIIKGVTNG